MGSALAAHREPSEINREYKNKKDCFTNAGTDRVTAQKKEIARSHIVPGSSPDTRPSAPPRKMLAVRPDKASTALAEKRWESKSAMFLPLVNDRPSSPVANPLIHKNILLYKRSVEAKALSDFFDGFGVGLGPPSIVAHRPEAIGPQ